MEENTMQSRKVDELGRIVLPVEIRTRLGVESGDSLDVSIDETGTILLKKTEKHCVICHGQNGLVDVRDKPICVECRDIIKNQ
jgi:transcriptional pleiotropic regulator of transition state genes